MKDYFYLEKSKFLLLTLFAFLVGGLSPAWAQKTLPYEYGFESTSSTADGWTKTSCHGSTENYNLGVASGHGGSYVFQFYYNSNPPQYLISPELATSDKTIDVSFVYKVQSNTYEESFKVGYSTTDTETTSFTFEDEVKTKSTTWTEYTTTLPAGTKYVCIAYTANDKYYLYIDDFCVEAAGALRKPNSLGASDITSSSATLNWTAGGTETSWEISYSTSSDVPADEGSYTSANSTTYNLTGLSAGTTYYVYVRSKDGCEYSAWSDAYSFTTTQVAVAAEGYSDDFEDACNWMLINGGNTNAWTWGSATNNGGSKALYISNDGGSTNAYGTGATMVYASKLFSFQGGTYNFTYDWICKGEKSSYGSSVYDYMRIALVPTNATLTAGTNAPTGFSGTGLPTGWIALDGGAALVDVSEWQHKSEAVAVEAGNYYVVLCWRNDDSGGTNPPAAIDNFSITVQTCPVPSNLTMTDIAARQATLNWATSSNTWEVYCTTEEGTPAADVTITAANISTNSYTFTGLTPETKYYAWVRSVSGSDKSEWAGTNFTTDISCHAPTGLTVAEITSTGATLDWTSDAEDFNARYKKVSDADWTLVEGVINAKSYTLTGLTPATAYQAQVRTYCDATDQSAWTDAASFTTDCAAVTEFPFAENFNGITAGIPDCWNNNEGTTNTINYRWSYYASGHDGACLRFNSYNNQNGITNMLKTPAMIFPSDKTMLLTFWYKNPAGGDFSVFISNDGGTTYTTELATGLTGVSAWTEKEIVLPADFTENVVIVFKGTSNYGSGDAYIYLDDVTIDEAPACAKPTALAASNVTAHSVELNWTNGSDEEAWQVAYGTTANFDADAATPVEVNTNPYTLTGLAANTSYYICVRAKKGSDVSAWSDMVNFTTEPSCITPTDFAVSATTINSATLTWTDATEQSKWEVSYSTTSGAPEEGTIVTVTEKTYTIEGLTAGTTYYASVRAINSDDDKSEWSSEISFIPGVVIANEGTSTNGNLPLYGYDADTANGTQCQFIIPATSLTSVAGNQIDKIAFYSSYATKDWGNAEFDVYVKEVENTAFENTTLVDWTTMTKVYSGKLSVNDSQMVITFEDPFAYEGGNLMIGVNQTAKGKYSPVSWYGVTTSDYSALQKGSRYQFLPKTAFYYSPVVIAPKMEVSETELAYGLVAPNSEQTKTFTIENKGKADLTGINVSSDSEAFTVTDVQNQTIAVGGEAITVTVTLNTETAGEYEGTITVSATDQEDAEIAISGTVRDANKIFIDFAENAMPATWSMASGWSVSNEMAYNNGTAANIISGEVAVDEGGENIFFDYKGANTWGVDYDYVKVYYATTGNGSEADWTLIDDATFGCTDNTTWHQAKVTIPAVAKYICLQGKYIYIDNFYGLALPLTPYMVFSASDYNFGMIATATTTETYIVQNTGMAELTGLSITSDNDNFTVAVTDDATTIAAKGQATFIITMKADTKGVQSGTITVNADGFEAVAFNVSGYVVDDSKFYVTFDDNQQPEGWSENTGWTFANGKATPSTDAQITLPALSIADGEKMAISVEATGSNPELFFFTSTDGGSTWSAKSANLASGVTTTAYSVVYIDGLAAGDYKLKLQGYHIQIDALNGFTVNANAPELFVAPTDEANFGTKIKAQPEAKTYIIFNTGTGTLTGTITSSVTDHFTVSESEFSLGAGESMTFDIALVFDENYGEKASVITIHPTVAGLSDVVINATATTADPNVWDEDFAAGIPTTWINENNVWTTTRYGHDGQAGPGNNNTATLTTPRLEATKDQVLTFDVIDAESETYFLKAEYSTDGKNWTLIENYTTAGNKSFTAPEDGFYYLRFTGNYTYVDNFYGFKLSLPDHVMAITASNIPTSTMKATKSFEATVTVQESRGVNEENVVAKVYMGEEVIGTSEAVTVEANETKQITITATPTMAATEGAQMHIEVEWFGGTLSTTPVTRYVAELVTLALTETEEQEISTGYSAVYDEVTLTRSFVQGWNTFVAPVAVSLSEIDEDAVAYSFTGYENGSLTFTAVTETLTAATPYVIYVPDAITSKTFTWETPVISSYYVGKENIKTTEDGATFQGTYAPIAAGNWNASGVVYGLTNEARIAKANTAKASIKGFRAYFDLPAGVEVKTLRFDGLETGVRTISVEEFDGQLFDINGRKVNKTQRGIYVVNGKKVIVK